MGASADSHHTTMPGAVRSPIRVAWDRAAALATRVGREGEIPSDRLTGGRTPSGRSGDESPSGELEHDSHANARGTNEQTASGPPVSDETGRWTDG